jgi:hypothetical protein
LSCEEDWREKQIDCFALQQSNALHGGLSLKYQKQQAKSFPPTQM